MILINQFKLGIIAKDGRRISQTPLLTAEEFDLPYNFCIHHTNDSPSAVAIRGSHPVIRTWAQNGSTGVYVVSDFKKKEGRVRMLPMSSSAIAKYYQSQANLTKVIKLDRTISREKQLLVMDYSMLYKRIEVPVSRTQYHDKYLNLFNATYENIDEQTAIRSNVIVVPFPENLPDKEEFIKVKELEPTATEYDVFVSENHFWIRELWLLMLGKSKLIELFKKTTVYISIVNAESIITIDAKRLYEEGQSNFVQTRNDVYSLLETIAEIKSDSDTEALNSIQIDESMTKEAAEKEVDEVLLENTKQAVQLGIMTPKEQDRFVKIAAKSKDIPAPDGRPLSQFIKTDVDKDYDLPKGSGPKLDAKITGGVKTSSTLDRLNDTYIKTVYPKHMAAVASSFTAEGYILTDYAVDEVIDASNHYNKFKFKILPTNGKETVFDLPVPVINEQGFYTADSVQYSLDCQLVDKKIFNTVNYIF